jgi:hypothetical protein
MESSMEAPQKKKKKKDHMLQQYQSWGYSQRNLSQDTRDTCTPMFTAAQEPHFGISPDTLQPTNGSRKYVCVCVRVCVCVCTHNEILFSHKKLNYGVCRKMEETEDHVK